MSHKALLTLLLLAILPFLAHANNDRTLRRINGDDRIESSAPSGLQGGYYIVTQDFLSSENRINTIMYDRLGINKPHTQEAYSGIETIQDHSVSAGKTPQRHAKNSFQDTIKQTGSHTSKVSFSEVAISL